MTPVFINCTAETFTPTKSGAIATWIWEMCQAAHATGVEPLVITRTRDDAESYPWARTIPLEYPGLPAFRGAGRIFELQRRLQGWGHIRQGAYMRRVIEAIKDAGVEGGPFVLHNDIEMTVILKNTFPQAFLLHHAHNDNGVHGERYRKSFRLAPDLATACSEWTRHWNENYFGFEGEEMRTLYNGVNPQTFSPEANNRNSKAVISFHGRIDEHKAPDVLLKAALQLAERTTDFAVQIVGRKYYWKDESDPYGESLVRMSESLENKGVEVKFTGWVERRNLPETLRQADIHVTPSRWPEPFGLTTIEAMASGLATIGSRTGGTPEVIGDAGMLFERDNVDELADHLQTLVEDRAHCFEWAKKARERALSLTWNHCWNQLQTMLQGPLRVN